MKLGDGSHLTYCTNIHPGETWPEVYANLQRHLPRVRSRVAPDAAFGVGLRLSAAAAATLAEPARLAGFRRFLDENDFYVFTLNGFPYGAFHGVRVKESVYAPDWRDPARLAYTDQLADLLAQLLPEQWSGPATVSTVPGAYKAALGGADDVEVIRQHLIRHVAHLVELERRTGHWIQLLLEPEPCCMLETVDETTRLFEEQLYAGKSASELAALAGIDVRRSREALRRHIGVCIDLCHAAVEFEDPESCFDVLAAAGIPVGKVQVSAGLAIRRFDAEAIGELRRFVDPVYLHQVVERGPRGLRRFADLPEALATLDDASPPDEWRVHFHVPVFHDDLGAFRSTRGFIEAALRRHRRKPLSAQFEVETYTWDVLPAALRNVAVDEAIARELAWVREASAA